MFNLIYIARTSRLKRKAGCLTWSTVKYSVCQAQSMKSNPCVNMQGKCILLLRSCITYSIGRIRTLTDIIEQTQKMGQVFRCLSMVEESVPVTCWGPSSHTGSPSDPGWLPRNPSSEYWMRWVRWALWIDHHDPKTSLTIQTAIPIHDNNDLARLSKSVFTTELLWLGALIHHAWDKRLGWNFINTSLRLDTPVNGEDVSSYQKFIRKNNGIFKDFHKFAFSFSIFIDWFKRKYPISYILSYFSTYLQPCTERSIDEGWAMLDHYQC